MNDSFLIDINDLPIMVWIIDAGTFAVKHTNKKALKFSPDPLLKLKEKDQLLLRDIISRKTNEKSLYFEISESNSESKWIMFQVTHSVKTSDIHLTGSEVTKFESSEFQLKQILDAIPDMILVKEENSKIVWANLAFQSYYNMSIEDLQKMSIDAAFNKPDYTKQYLFDDAWVWNNQKTLIIDCEPVTRHDGVVRKFQTIKAPIFNIAGEVRATVGISRDMTEEIENRERSYASSKMASLGEMAGGISHEINNPLSVVLGRVGQMRQKLISEGAKEDDRGLYYLGSISENIYRIVKIIDGLRSFCYGGTSEVFEKKNVSEVVFQVLTYCSNRFIELGINCEVDIPEDLVVEMKSVSFSQILLNLLNNAIDAVHNLNSPWIKISARIHFEHFELRVFDSGSGVADDIATKIMQPFFTTKSIDKGTGLGLSISQTIAHQHGGNITLDRTVSKSCFLLRFPYHQVKL